MPRARHGARGIPVGSPIPPAATGVVYWLRSCPKRHARLGEEGSMVLKVDVPGDLIGGEVDEGYGAVADEFRRNFAERGEIGAACAVYRDGRKVVDLWGGYRNGHTRQPWREDTVVTVFSSTKGVSGLAIAVAHSRGLLD